MIISNQDILMDGQAITASARSSNVIDLGAPGRVVGEAADVAYDIGKGSEKELIIQVTETFLTCTSVKIRIDNDGDEAFGSANVLLETEAIPVATLVAGYQFPIDAIPRFCNERYISLYATVAGSNATAGKITAFFAPGRQTN